MSKISSASAKPASAAAASPKLDARLVREIATMLSESDLTEIEVEKGDLRIRVARQTTIVASAPAQAYAPAPAAIAVAAAHSLPDALVVDEHNAADVLKSPMVGTVYLRPSPDAKAFVEIGSHVSSGQKDAADRGDEDVQRHCRA